MADEMFTQLIGIRINIFGCEHHNAKPHIIWDEQNISMSVVGLQE